MVKIKLPKKPHGKVILYFDYSKEEPIETEALKLSLRENIELQVNPYFNYNRGFTLLKNTVTQLCI